MSTPALTTVLMLMGLSFCGGCDNEVGRLLGLAKEGPSDLCDRARAEHWVDMCSSGPTSSHFSKSHAPEHLNADIRVANEPVYHVSILRYPTANERDADLDML